MVFIFKKNKTEPEEPSFWDERGRFWGKSPRISKEKTKIIEVSYNNSCALIVDKLDLKNRELRLKDVTLT